MVGESFAAPQPVAADADADGWDFDMNPIDYYSTFAKEGGRVGSGALGSGQGGVARCAR